MLDKHLHGIKKVLAETNLAQTLRFGAVGAINTLFSYSVYVFLLYCGLNFALANLGSVVLGILFSFRTQGALVFNNSDRSLLGRFFLAWLCIYLLMISLIWIFSRYGVEPYLGGALALPFSATASYFIQKYYVFSER
jgi:putative flippase GtrA